MLVRQDTYSLEFHYSRLKPCYLTQAALVRIQVVLRMEPPQWCTWLISTDTCEQRDEAQGVTGDQKGAGGLSHRQ